MHVDLARTFLAVIETGSFIEAARRVHVTQSTVSMRIKALEERLGTPLFARNKAGATLTRAGGLFQKHALTLVRAWEQARLEVSLPADHLAALVVGGSYSLWDGFLLGWLALMREHAPDIALRSQLGFSAALMQGLVDSTLDLAVMYTPQRRPGLAVEGLFEEELILVTSAAAPADQPGRNYIYVDWGPEFQADHSLNFPDLSTPALYMELGSLGLKYLLSNEAAGYFPHRLVADHLRAGRLQRVAGARVFTYPVYAVYPTAGAGQGLEPALHTLRTLAAEQPPAR